MSLFIKMNAEKSKKIETMLVEQKGRRMKRRKKIRFAKDVDDDRTKS